MNNSYMCCLKIMLANGKTIMFWERTYIWLWLFVRDEVYNMCMIKKFCLPVVFLKSYMGLSRILKNPLLYLHQLCGFLLLFFFFFSFKSPCSQATLKVRYMEGMVGEGCWGKGRTEDEEFPVPLQTEFAVVMKVEIPVSPWSRLGVWLPWGRQCHCLSKWITWDHTNLNSWHLEWFEWVSRRRKVKASERECAYLACIIVGLHWLSSNFIGKSAIS